MNRLVSGDLVHQTSIFLETHPLVIFQVAKVYKQRSGNRTEAQKALATWQSRGVYDKDIEDFCLDVLSKRIGLETTLIQDGVKWRIYGQGKFLPAPR